MTVKEVLELKQAGLSTEEIAQLAQHITAEPAPAAPAAPAANIENLFAEMKSGLSAMQEQLVAMQESKKAEIVEAVKKTQETMQFGNVTRPTGAEPAAEPDTQKEIFDLAAAIINPQTKEAIGGVNNA